MIADSDNASKSTIECLQIMIKKLNTLWYRLPPEFQTTEFLTHKITDTYQGIQACRYAIADPPSEEGQLINMLQSANLAYEKEQKHQPQRALESSIRDLLMRSKTRALTDPTWRRQYHAHPGATV